MKLMIPILFVLFNGCEAKNPGHYSFWKIFFEYQNEFRMQFQKSGKLEILNGNLVSDKEELIRKTPEGGFYLSVFKSNQTGSGLSEIERRESLDGDKIFSTVSFSPSRFEETDTYLVKRKIIYRYLPVYSWKDFINWVRSLQVNNISNILNTNPVYKFVCENFECNLLEIDEYWELSLKPNRKLKNLDPYFYEKLLNLMKKANVEFNWKDEKEENRYVSFFIKSQDLKLRVYKKELIRKNPEILKLVLDIDANFFGVNILIRNLKYRFQFFEGPGSYKMIGKFENIPYYKISGRVAYIIPTYMVDLFIPGNIEGYFDQFFRIRTKGNQGKGTFMVVESKIKKNTMDLITENELENPQKPFRFLSSKSNEKESNRFVLDFEKYILESMYAF